MRDDQREHDRYDTSISVEVRTSNGVLYAAAHDISRGGLRFECDADAVAVLFPRGGRRSEPVEVDVRLPLPFLTRPNEVIQVRCRAAWVHPTEADEMVVGLEFVGLSESVQDQVASYVLERERYAF